MYAFKLNSFSKWAKSEKLTNQQLLELVKEIELGLVDADLGSGLVKKRLARKGQGKRDGYRVLLAFKLRKRIIFLFGFAKNEQGNIASEQLNILRKLSKNYLCLTDSKILELVKSGTLVEIEINESAT